MPEEQWYAICDNASGEAVSFSTSIGDLGASCVAVPVDGPPDGRTWDATRRAYGPKVERAKTAREKAAAAFEQAQTTDEKIAAIAMALGIA